MQSRRASAVEAVITVVVGYLVGMLTQIIVFPMFGIHIPLHDNFFITGIFSAVSLAYKYIIRRTFVLLEHNSVGLPRLMILTYLVCGSGVRGAHGKVVRRQDQKTVSLY